MAIEREGEGDREREKILVSERKKKRAYKRED